MIKKAKLIIAVLVVVLAAWLGIPLDGSSLVTVDSRPSQKSSSAVNDHHRLPSLINNQTSGVMLLLDAEVINILPDDVKGSKHQRLILSVMGTEYTLLLAHNIDLAPRVPVKKYDHIRVYGQYEWNDKGGVIHWTHRDSKNKHPHGWVEHNNKRYQ